MPTGITHAISAVAIASCFPRGCLTRRALVLGAVCSVAPDLDVFPMRFGVAYEHFFGHRGFTHSLVFAAALAGAVALILGRALRGPPAPQLWLYAFLCTASHGLLDALTNGGLGVAFFSPFENGRYFWPWQPIEVSPIGPRHFFTQRGLDVLLSEALWVWLPCAALILLGTALRRVLQSARRPAAR